MTSKWEGIKKKEYKQTKQCGKEKKNPQATSAGMVNTGNINNGYILKGKLPPTNEKNAL